MTGAVHATPLTNALSANQTCITWRMVSAIHVGSSTTFVLSVSAISSANSAYLSLITSTPIVTLVLPAFLFYRDARSAPQVLPAVSAWTNISWTTIRNARTAP